MHDSINALIYRLQGTFADETMLYIDPEVCIDCGACEPACPVQAIFPADLTPEKWKQYIQMNADWYKNRS